MLYLESPSTDHTFNLALEQYVFDTLSRNGDFFMLWQNSDSVIVGLHQNTAEEVNRTYVERNGIPVVRRLSGGGAVFHDLGNLNFSFITATPYPSRMDYRFSCQPILGALASLGLHAETNGRNDITIDGKKFSENARYLRGGRLIHHGTILFHTDFQKMSEALRVSEDKFISKSIKSVRARVTNLCDYLPYAMTVREFWNFLLTNISAKLPMSPYTLTGKDCDAVEEIRRQRYAAWDWNYGQSPNHGIQKHRHLPGFGSIRIRLQIENGRIAAFGTDGDYFGSRPCSDIAAALLHVKMEEASLTEALSSIPLEEYYEQLSRTKLIRWILE